MAKITKIIILIMVATFIATPNFVFAQEDSEQNNYQEEIFEAKVLEILEQKETIREDGSKSILQKLKLKGLEGKWKDQEIIFDGTEVDVIAKNLYKKGNKVLVSHSQDGDGNDYYYVTDFVRRENLYFLAVIFVLIILITGKWRGFRALLGLIFSFFIILKIIIPQILNGHNALFISLTSALLIIFVSTYLVYGLNKKSTIAILGTFAGIAIVGFFSILFTNLTKLAGFAEEETIYLVGLTGGNINLQGLLLAGFIVGALGVLDDITVSQVSTVQEIHGTDPSLTRLAIYKKAMRVGVDHIASMVNTLFLAYAGAALPLLLLFSFKQPPFLTFSQIINHEIIATEIVRTLVGSIGLALAVPITTFLAAYFYKNKNLNGTGMENIKSEQI
ncbi:MAG: YibE/F family protein [Patescibacteria group bacterium]